MRTRALAIFAAGLLLSAGCTSSMDKPSMDEPITVDTALDAERRLTGGRETLLAPPQQAQQPAAATTDKNPPAAATRSSTFPDGLAPPPRPARRAREP